MSKITKMTEREMFAMIAELLEDNADVVAFCEKKVAALDRKAENAKVKAAEKKAAGDELRARVEAVLTDEWQTIADVVNALGDEEVTANKVTYRLNALVELGVAVKDETKLPGDGKTRVVKVFKLA